MRTVKKRYYSQSGYHEDERDSELLTQGNCESPDKYLRQDQDDEIGCRIDRAGDQTQLSVLHQSETVSFHNQRVPYFGHWLARPNLQKRAGQVKGEMGSDERDCEPIHDLRLSEGHKYLNILQQDREFDEEDAYSIENR